MPGTHLKGLAQKIFGNKKKEDTSSSTEQNDNAFISSTQKMTDSFSSITENSFEINKTPLSLDDKIVHSRDEVTIENPHFLLQESDIIATDKELGKGRYATVYLGKWNGKEVAIKQINLSLFSYGRSVKESNMLAQFIHSNYVIHFYGYFKNDVHFNLVTEYIPNGSLLDLINGSKLPSWETGRQQIWDDMCKALKELHALDIIHRDLKSANILLSEDKNGIHVKIADLGFAIHKTEPKPYLAGTLPWMAPEVLTNQSYSKESDVFALGRTGGELVNKTPPFPSFDVTEEDGREKLATHIQQGHEDSLSSDCPPKIYNQIKSCLLFDPKDRPTASMLVKENNNIDNLSSVSLRNSNS